MWNESQQEAINSIDGGVQVIAAAGSGKTSVLVERIHHMTELGIDEKDILVISFTAASAEDLKKKLSDYLLFDVTVGTFHAICKTLLEEAGCTDLLIQPNKYKLKRAMENETKIKNINIDEVLSFIGFQKNHMIGFSDKFCPKESSYEEQQIRTCYKVYENYKSETHSFDFEDWQIMTYFKYQSGELTKKWKYVAIDETQDCSNIQYELMKLWCSTNNIFVVGDIAQCWEENCEVNLGNGSKKNVRDIQIGDLVECNKGGHIKYMPVTNKTKHVQQHLIKISTQKGYSITTTTDHKFFVHDPIFEEGTTYLYLMFRYDRGFRIGLTMGGKTKDLRNRINAENPDRLWILKQFINNDNEAFYQEEFYSLKYQIPKIPFHCSGRGIRMNQEGLNRIFDEYGGNGYELLTDFNMDFNYPNFICQNTKKQTPSVKIYHYATSRPAAQYSAEFEYHGERIRKYYNNFKDCYIAAQEIMKNKNAGGICERLSMPCAKGTPYRVVCGSNVMVGMDIPVVVNGEFFNDKVLSIEYINGQYNVYDIEVSSSGTMVANNILSHNCIYAWRSASPELFANFSKTMPDVKVINMNINYRSSKNIVAKANGFIKPYVEKYGNFKDAEAFDQTDGNIETHMFDDPRLESVAVCEKIKELVASGADCNDIAVLYRNNANADIIESLLKRANVPYNLVSSQSFFDKKEIKGIISILRLMSHTDDDEAFEYIFSDFRCYPLTFFKKDVIDELKVESGKKNYSLFEAFIDHRFAVSWQNENKNKFVNTILKDLRLQLDRNTPIERIINNICSAFKIEQMIKEKYECSVWDDKFDSINNLKMLASGQTVQEFLQFVTNSRPVKKKNKDGVTLSTIHRAKGLQWKHVFVIGLREEKFPSSMGDMDEESHIMYVAVTRPEKWLWVSSIGKSQFYTEYTNAN